MQDEKTITHFNFNVVLAKGIYVGHRKLNADQAPCIGTGCRVGCVFRGTPWLYLVTQVSHILQST